jgi:predicted ATPase
VAGRGLLLRLHHSCRLNSSVEPSTRSNRPSFTGTHDMATASVWWSDSGLPRTEAGADSKANGAMGGLPSGTVSLVFSDVSVRVRMGVHTGNPTVHDGGYVGMDVHRAARIAAAAHGGQVVISSATAELLGGNLPAGVGLRDLGSHLLKDIAAPERLFQLAIDGLQTDFPALKSLGASSSLPVPATPLVGRDGELAELTAVLGMTGVRLVTLTGPGGSGKTRLAVGLAQRLVDPFRDGVYFVPLAAVTSPEVMWTTIAEVLDVPPEGRVPPAFFTHVAHRSALLVLDNLEQITGVDTVVSQLLTEAPHVVIIATSRRPLHLAAEHQHPVPPLELPNRDDLEVVHRSGAVQLFEQQARRVRPDFTVMSENAIDVVAVCRRLDGLPLAIELAAARSKLLSPRALLTRLDTALEFKDTGVDRPSRQQTLRDTIAWSHDLLSQTLQQFLCRLGLFAGGADLEAIAAVAAGGDIDGWSAANDPLDLLAELVDASLLSVTESADGEPRFQMLGTVRSYALERLRADGDLEAVRERHAYHYLEVAEGLRSPLFGEHHVEARVRFETEHDNYREALAWALPASEDALSESGGRLELGLRLCRALFVFWDRSGYSAEARGWLERATSRAVRDGDNLDLAACLDLLASCLRRMGELNLARDTAAASVEMHRRLHDAGHLGNALATLAQLESHLGHPAVARRLYDEALATARRSDRPGALLDVLASFAIFEGAEKNLQRSLELDAEALSLARQAGNIRDQGRAQHNMACTLREMGRLREAHRQMHSLIPVIRSLNDPGHLTVLAEDYAAILAELGDHARAVRLWGAADAMRERLAMPRDPWQVAEIAEPMAKAQAALSAAEWHEAHQTGRNTTVDDALADAHAAVLS